VIHAPQRVRGGRAALPFFSGARPPRRWQQRLDFVDLEQRAHDAGKVRRAPVVRRPLRPAPTVVGGAAQRRGHGRVRQHGIPILSRVPAQAPVPEHGQSGLAAFEQLPGALVLRDHPAHVDLLDGIPHGCVGIG
jgi:hypothetical protein